MKILYLHGLNSHLQDDRRAVLEPFGEITSPTFDYLEEKELFQKLYSDYQYVDVIIGSSLGGLLAYYLAQILEKPCLLFNPALPFREKLPFSHSFNKNYEKYMRIVIGLQDEVIPPYDSLKCISEDITPKQNTEIHLINKMKHSYDISIFSQECLFFFSKIKKN